MSKKEETKPPRFDESAAEDRKMRELYGNSGHKPIGISSAKKAAAAPYAAPASNQPDSMKSRKAA